LRRRALEKIEGFSFLRVAEMKKVLRTSGEHVVYGHLLGGYEYNLNP